MLKQDNKRDKKEGYPERKHTKMAKQMGGNNERRE